MATLVADPTPDQLVTFFAAVKQLRLIFDFVEIQFRGNNELPQVFASFKGQPSKMVTPSTDSVDDLTAALVDLYQEAVTEGDLRKQLADLLDQARTIQVQLGIR